MSGVNYKKGQRNTGKGDNLTNQVWRNLERWILPGALVLGLSFLPG